jgi:hypothetical protein
MYDKTCIGCGNEFATGDFRKKRCHPRCGRKTYHNARAEKRATNDLEFIGVDGEGVDRPDGAHEYVMLSVGQETLWRDGRALEFAEMMEFLYEQYLANKDAAFVGFFLGYDYIQWEKTLPERVARLLITRDGIESRKSQRKARANPYPDAVVYQGWEIDVMANRRWKLRPHVHHKSEHNGKCRNRTCGQQMGDPQGYSFGEPDFDPEQELRQPPESPEGEIVWEKDPDMLIEYCFRMHLTGKGKEKVKTHGWMYICDTGPFWQTSFLNVINPKGWNGNPVCSEDELALVVAGKSDRGHVYDYGDASYYDEMRQYNILENEILSRVTTRLNAGFMNDTIPIKLNREDWYGPGRAAQKWMDMLHARIADPVAVEHNKGLEDKRERVNEGGLLNADIYMSMPSWFNDAARASYYGGWFEQFMHGHVGNAWEYDINSAYPFIIASLPCLHTTNGHNGEYTQGTGENYPVSGDRYTLLYGTVRGSDPYIGAMPYRTPDGKILRPSETKGWYWLHELEAGKRARLIDSISVEEWVSYQPCECPPPFDPEDIGITRMYNLRLEAGKNTPAGKALKLVYNSAYGKTAQSIGTPKYSNPVYASLITAGCRTLILDAIASHPEGTKSVSMVATDGVYFTSRHPSLDMDTARLGAWDETSKVNLTQLMPGVYWDEKTREGIAKGLSPSLKSRGVNAKDLAGKIEDLDNQYYQLGYDVAMGREYVWPSAQLSIKFRIESAKSALNRNNWQEAGKVEHNGARDISGNPNSKRDPNPYCDGYYIRTAVVERGIDLDSLPYDKSFGWIADDTYTTKEGGDGLDWFRELLGSE